MIKNSVKTGMLLPVVTFLLILASILIVWGGLKKSLDEEIQDSLTTSGKAAVHEFKFILNNDIERLENLKMRLEFTKGAYFNHWEDDAQLLLEQNPSFQFIEWIDSSMIIKKIQPLTGNEGAVNLDISKVGYRKKEWIEHSQHNMTNITPWSKMTQGGHAFLIDVPVYLKNTFQGTITAGMDFTNHLDHFADELKEYTIELTDYNGTLFYEFNEQNKAENKAGFVFKDNILIDNLHNKYWSFKMYPTKSLFASDRSVFIEYFLLIGIFLALLISSLVYFYIKAKSETNRAIAYSKALSKSNQNLKKEKQTAIKASKAQSEFLSNMSHEIRTPLHAILGFVQILKTSQLNKTDREYIALLDASSTNLLSIVNDILVIDKIESGNVKLEETHFNPSQKIQELINTYKHLFTNKDLYLHSKFKEPFGCHAIGDPNKLSQIVINILKNASKFTNKGGVSITYSEQQIGNQLKLKIRVEDTGIGIPKNKIQTVFSRFSQIESSLEKQHEGSGLGLAICKELATLLGGNISVKSTLGQGSKFEISVVFKIAEKQYENDIKETYENLNLSHLKALIVDDNKINIVILKKILEGINIQIDSVLNGKHAVEKVKNNFYDMVFMDIHMPEMNGYIATRLIRTFNKDIKIFALSANITDEAIAKALDSGMDHYISKPFTKEQLFNLILTSLDYGKLHPKVDLNNKKAG